MSDAEILDLARLRRSCGQCSLRELCVPVAIGVDDLNQLERIVKRKRPVSAKGHLFSSGSRLKNLYVVREGSFKTIALAEDGQQQVIGFHLPGDLIGLDGLSEDNHRCDAEALEDSSVCEVPLDMLESVAAQVPSLQHQLMRVLGKSMGRDQDHIEMLGRRQASERLLIFLHRMVERYRMLGQPTDQLVLTMSREDIANYLGLAIETVSRCFSRLQEDGMISVRGRHLRILDSARFTELAHKAASG